MSFPAYTPKVRVQKPAPAFKGTAVVDGAFEDVSLETYTNNKQWLVLGFVPMAWTFVCPTEIIAFSDRIADFKARNASVVFASTDSEYSLLAWASASRRDGGLGSVNIPLYADKNHQLAKDYGVLIEEEGIALRGLFLIDPNGVVRQITINDLPVGRSVDETLRLLDAFQFTDKYGEVCPANWNPGQETIKATPEGIKAYHAKSDTKMADNGTAQETDSLMVEARSEATPSSTPPLSHPSSQSQPQSQPTATAVPDPSGPDTSSPIKRSLSLRSVLSLLAKKRAQLQHRISSKHFHEKEDEQENSNEKEQGKEMEKPQALLSTESETEKKEALAQAALASDTVGLGHPALRPAATLDESSRFVPLATDSSRLVALPVPAVDGPTSISPNVQLVNASQEYYAVVAAGKDGTVDGKRGKHGKDGKGGRRKAAQVELLVRHVY